MRNVAGLKLTTSGDRAVIMTREFDAPRALVFDAFTKPELLKRWFNGPPGWSLAVCEFDLRVGGRYRYVWRGPDGSEMGMGGTLLEIAAPQRLVATEQFEQSWYPGEAVGTLELTENGGITLLTQTIVYESRETRDAVLQSPMEQGVAAGYNSLAAFLEELKTA